LLSAGEVAPVDLTRARLQINTRRDELEQARANEAIAGDSLRLFVGYDFNQPIATTDLLIQMPQLGEVESFTADALQRRPEFVRFDAERRAAEQDIRLARAERRPQVTYNISGGFDTDSLRLPRIGQHAGASASIGLSIPIFDAGISRSRARQAGLRAQVAESTRLAALKFRARILFRAHASVFSRSAHSFSKQRYPRCRKQFDGVARPLPRR
jgi:outer membrane protein TolC